MDEVEVDMDGVWKSVVDPDWLTTYGVTTCVAVGVADDDAKRAWLIHSPAFGHSISQLQGMLQDSLAMRCQGKGLRIWVTGGAPLVSCEEANLVQDAVRSLIQAMAAQATVTFEWGSKGMVELILTDGKWLLNGEA